MYRPFGGTVSPPFQQHGFIRFQQVNNFYGFRNFNITPVYFQAQQRPTVYNAQAHHELTQENNVTEILVNHDATPPTEIFIDQSVYSSLEVTHGHSATLIRVHHQNNNFVSSLFQLPSSPERPLQSFSTVSTQQPYPMQIVNARLADRRFTAYRNNAERRMGRGVAEHGMGRRFFGQRGMNFGVGQPSTNNFNLNTLPVVGSAYHMDYMNLRNPPASSSTASQQPSVETIESQFRRLTLSPRDAGENDTSGAPPSQSSGTEAAPSSPAAPATPTAPATATAPATPTPPATPTAPATACSSTADTSTAAPSPAPAAPSSPAPELESGNMRCRSGFKRRRDDF